MIPLLTETGSFTVSDSSSRYLAFLFAGNDEFLERTKNLCVNYGIVERGSFHKFRDQHYYCLTPLDRLKDGLLNYFRGEVIFEKSEEINYVATALKDELGDTVEITVDWDEQKVMELAECKLNRFFGEKVRWENILDLSQKYSPAAEYSLGTINAERE